MALMPHHNPTDYGWKEDNGRLIPVWTTLSEAKEVFHVNILCFCKQTCSSLRCKSTKANLKCSLLCKCQCRTLTYFTYQIETSSTILEHVAKIDKRRRCDPPDDDACGGRILIITRLPGPASFINSLTSGCAYTMDDYTNACVFEERKA